MSHAQSYNHVENSSYVWLLTTRSVSCRSNEQQQDDQKTRWTATTTTTQVYSLECCSFTQKWSNQEFECCFGTHTRANNVMNDILLMVPHVICILRTLLRCYLAFCRCTMDAAKILEFENPFNGVHLEWFDHSKYIWLIIVIAYKCPCLKV